MNAGVWVRYLFGEGRAIREVAESRSAFWTGIGLVLLTAIARNYDQTFIGENPVLWLFGPLLFSLVSGTWLYVIVYGWLARLRMKEMGGGKPGFWSGWREFMGLFWLTAPIAWLYAIPVERFFDPVTAAKANIFLLTAVSLWRVLLMTRVVQHLATAPFFIVLLWVLFAASVEALVVFFFGGAFARAIMQGMGGMRNSPAEDVLQRAMGVAFEGSLCTAPIALVLSLGLRTRRPVQPLPTVSTDTFRVGSLVVAAALWVCVSIVPQIELARNVAVEKLLAKGKARETLDYFSRHQPGQFAPARTLPPKPFEYSVFKELPACLDAVQPSDATWVRVFLVQRLNETMVHYRPRWGWDRSKTTAEQIESIRRGVQSYHSDADGLLKLVSGLTRIPEGQAWLATNGIFLQALQQIAREASDPTQLNYRATASQQTNWLSLSNRLRNLLPNVTAISTTNHSGASLHTTP